MKLQVYDAVVKSKVAYGLESAQLTNALKAKFDTFQLKGLRQILRMQATYMNRANTNEKVYQQATEHLAEKHPDKQVQRLSAYIDEKGLKLLGHLLRAMDDDPVRASCLRSGTAAPKHLDVKRTGRPRQSWMETKMQEAWRLSRMQNGLPATPFSRQDHSQLDALHTYAFTYEF